MPNPSFRGSSFQSFVLGVLALFTLIPFPVRADDGRWDEYLFAAGRLLPQGLAVSGTLGYGQVFWGESGGGKVLFGYIRPSATLQTSIVVNHADLGVDLFPVSFAGMRIGVSGSQRAVDLDTLNCSVVYCHGLLGTAYLKPQLLFGYGPFAAMASFRAAWFASSNSTLPFGEDQSSLAGLAGGDSMVGSEIAAQVRINGPVAVGTYLTTSHMLGSGSTNQLLSVFGKYTSGAFSYMAGAGAYQSTTQSTAFTCYVVLGWTRLPSIALF